MQRQDPRDFKEYSDYSIKKEVTTSLWKIKNKKSNKSFQNKFLSEGEAEAYLYKFLKIKYYTEDKPMADKQDSRLEKVPELSVFTGIVKIGNKLINPQDKDSRDIIDALHKKQKKEIELVQIRNRNKIK